MFDFLLHSSDATGQVPTQLGRLTELTRLHMYGNQLTGQLPWKKVYGLLCSVTGIAQTDARRVMEYYFPGMSRTPTQTITYEQFSNMIK